MFGKIDPYKLLYSYIYSCYLLLILQVELTIITSNKKFDTEQTFSKLIRNVIKIQE